MDWQTAETELRGTNLKRSWTDSECWKKTLISFFKEEAQAERVDERHCKPRPEVLGSVLATAAMFRHKLCFRKVCLWSCPRWSTKFSIATKLERSFGQLPELSLPAPTFCRDCNTVRTETGDSGSFDVTLRRLVVLTTFRRDVDAFLAPHSESSRPPTRLSRLSHSTVTERTQWKDSTLKTQKGRGKDTRAPVKEDTAAACKGGLERGRNTRSRRGKSRKKGATCPTAEIEENATTLGFRVGEVTCGARG